ncbi:MAG: OsmC family protein [Verrucomicrobia bacterium]|nr:OsmC family protein [Cytophagales bacterium]
MPTVQAVYLGELRTQATHVQSGNQIITDAPTDNNGKGEAFSPTDLVASALGSCMMTIMGIVASRHQIDLAGTTYEITKIMAASPRRIAEIQLAFTFPVLQLTNEQKQLLENAAHTCPVALTLSPEVVQQVTFHWQ